MATLGAGQVPPQALERRGYGVTVPTMLPVGVDPDGWIDSTNPLSKELAITFAKYSLRYSIWSLCGEPVFDFLFRWDDPITIANILQVLEMPQVSEQIDPKILLHSVANGELLSLPEDLRQRMALIRPLSVRFRIALSNKSFFVDDGQSLRAGKANPGLSKRWLEDVAPSLAGYGFPDMLYRATVDAMVTSRISSFAIDLPPPAGTWQSYSVPGSPAWEDLPDYFRRVFRSRQNLADIFITDVQIVEIRWPQDVLAGILLEALKRNRGSSTTIQGGQVLPSPSGQLIQNPTSVSPTVPIQDSTGTASVQLAEADTAIRARYTSLTTIARNPFTTQTASGTSLAIRLKDPLRGAELILRDASSRELGRRIIDAASSSMVIDASAGLHHIDLYRTGDFLGSIPWGVTGQNQERKTTQPVASVILLIDTSGSMQGSRISAAREGALRAAEKVIAAGGEVAVMAFSGDGNSPIHSRLDFILDLAPAGQFIAGLNASGGTPLAPALEAACRYMHERAKGPASSRIILLLTDGENSSGDVHTSLAALASAGILVRTETIGLELAPGSTAATQLQAISQASGGNYLGSVATEKLSASLAESIEAMRLLDLLGTMGTSGIGTQAPPAASGGTDSMSKIMRGW